MNCSICLDKLDKNIINCNTCIYKFHKKCLYNWLLESENYTNLICPICKNIITNSDNILEKIKKDLNKQKMDFLVDNFYNVPPQYIYIRYNPYYKTILILYACLLFMLIIFLTCEI